jgi:hypothetical protein
MRRGLFLFLFSIWIFHDSLAMAEFETIFSPKEDIKTSIFKGIESTTLTLDLAIHEVTSFDMAEALLKAKQRGVKVRIITDSKQAKTKFSKITYLVHQGIPVKVLGGKEKGLMNYRFAILDEQKVITGFYD